MMVNTFVAVARKSQRLRAPIAIDAKVQSTCVYGRRCVKETASGTGSCESVCGDIYLCVVLWVRIIRITIAPCRRILHPRFLTFLRRRVRSAPSPPPRWRLYSRLNSNDFVDAGSPLALRLRLLNCSRDETSPLARFGARRLAWIASHDE
jgi:hypothetical protein